MAEGRYVQQLVAVPEAKYPTRRGTMLCPGAGPGHPEKALCRSAGDVRSAAAVDFGIEPQSGAREVRSC